MPLGMDCTFINSAQLTQDRSLVVDANPDKSRVQVRLLLQLHARNVPDGGGWWVVGRGWWLVMADGSWVVGRGWWLIDHG